MASGLEFSPVKQTISTETTTTALETPLLLPVRVLYTLNSSSQYLLARQRRKVQVVPILGDKDRTNTAPPAGRDSNLVRQFAKVPLKTCLGAVCASSPELLADRSRDYSVYVLDPLESTQPGGKSIPPVSVSKAVDLSLPNNSPPSFGEGISVGMGLLSWCLSNDRPVIVGAEDDDEEGYIIGKLVKDRGADALEVIISLRETPSQTQQQHVLSLSSLGLTSGSLGDYCPVRDARSSCLPSSPKPFIPVPFQDSVVNAGLSRQCTHKNEGGSGTQTPPPSATSDNPRVGRPPGATTHPEKRARRLAIQSHKETLERMENIAKMQRGETYDKSLIRVSDHGGPNVTEEEIARQRKLLEELEARPLIVDRSSNLLTTKPLPKRTKSSTAIVPLAKNASARRKPRLASPANATTSGSGIIDNRAPSETSLDATTNNNGGNKHGTELLLSLLSSVLGKVDVSSAPYPTQDAVEKVKGKEKEIGGKTPVGDALTSALKELLPHLPNTAVQTNGWYTSATQSSVSLPVSTHIPTAPSGSNTGQRDMKYGLPSRQISPHPQGHRLFQTTEETFYNPRSSPNRPYDQHWAVTRTSSDNKIETPKVREDAHPVPGGGWARGRNLVPRATAATAPIQLPHPNWQTATELSAAGKSITSITQEQPDKENMPPTKGGGLKRTLAATTDTNEKEEGSPLKGNRKKRKQESPQTLGSDDSKSVGAKRPVMRSAERNKANTSGAPGLKVAASSPVRGASTKAVRNLPVMAMSEPDHLAPPLPVVATSASLDLMIEPPRTPPTRKLPLDDDAGASLFTPCAPEFTPQLRGGALLPNNSPPSSPSPVQATSRGSHVARSLTTIEVDNAECPETSLSRRVKTGWDLPPSSPPPPTSPISPHADVGSERDDRMILELSTPLEAKMKKDSTGETFEHCTTIKYEDISTGLAGGSSPLILQDSTYTSDFDTLTDDFDFGELSQISELGVGDEGLQLDVEELWSSLSPVIAQAQTDSIATNNHAEADFGYFDLGTDGSHVEAAIPSGVDAIKLAEDLKALFGGCVV